MAYKVLGKNITSDSASSHSDGFHASVFSVSSDK